MKIIGLCGGSGSGKGAVCQIFNRYGIPAIDTDMVYRDLTSAASDCLDELVTNFGDTIIESGALNRANLARIVFAEGSEDKLALLNAITHKYILGKTRDIIDGYRKEGVAAAIVDAPLLFESRFNEECDIIISVISDLDTRIARITARDGIDREAAMRRVSAQRSDSWLIDNSDFVIQNNGSIADLELQVERIINEIM